MPYEIESASRATVPTSGGLIMSLHHLEVLIREREKQILEDAKAFRPECIETKTDKAGMRKILTGFRMLFSKCKPH